MHDTIVVNQPRLTTDEEMLVPQSGTEGMEMTLVTDSEGNTKLLPSDQVVGYIHLCIINIITHSI